MQFTKANPPWRILDAVVIFILVNIFIIALRIYGSQYIQGVLNYLPGGDTVINKLFINSTIQTSLFLILIFYYVFIKYKNNCQILGLKGNNITYWIKVGLINGIGLFTFITFIGILLNILLPKQVEPQSVAQIIMQAKTGWEKFIPLLVTGIFAPISEELYFRGFLYPALRKKIGVKLGIIITSLIFGCLHLDLIRAIPLTLGGIWLNWLYERSGSLYPSIIAHGVWNSIMTLLIFVTL